MRGMQLTSSPPRLAFAKRTDSGRERFIDFLVPSPVRSRFVAEHVSEGRPARIEHGLRQAGFGESGGIHITDRDVIKLSNDTVRELVVKVTARVADPRMNVGRLSPFAGALRDSEFASQLAQKPRIFDLLPIRQGSKVFKAQVNANATSNRPRLGRRDLHDDVQKPVPAGIAGEIRAVLDLAFGQRSGMEHPKGVSGKAKGVPLALEVAALQRHPAQGAPAAPAQERSIPLTAGLGVLLAHRINRAGVQGQFLAAPRSQPIQVKAARPALVPFERLQLSLVTEIPDEVAGARLAVEQSRQGFDAVSIHQQHRRMLMPFRALEKTLKRAETSTFTPLMFNSKSSARAIGRTAHGRPVIPLPQAAKYQFRCSAPAQSSSRPHPQERHFLPGVNAAVSVSKN